MEAAKKYPNMMPFVERLSREPIVVEYSLAAFTINKFVEEIDRADKLVDAITEDERKERLKASVERCRETFAMLLLEIPPDEMANLQKRTIADLVSHAGASAPILKAVPPPPAPGAASVAKPLPPKIPGLKLPPKAAAVPAPAPIPVPLPVPATEPKTEEKPPERVTEPSINFAPAPTPEPVSAAPETAEASDAPPPAPSFTPVPAPIPAPAFAAPSPNNPVSESTGTAIPVPAPLPAFAPPVAAPVAAAEEISVSLQVPEAMVPEPALAIETPSMPATTVQSVAARELIELVGLLEKAELPPKHLRRLVLHNHLMALEQECQFKLQTGIRRIWHKRKIELIRFFDPTAQALSNPVQNFFKKMQADYPSWIAPFELSLTWLNVMLRFWLSDAVESGFKASLAETGFMICLFGQDALPELETSNSIGISGLSTEQIKELTCRLIRLQKYRNQVLNTLDGTSLAVESITNDIQICFELLHKMQTGGANG
jgi:hypothetical protein